MLGFQIDRYEEAVSALIIVFILAAPAELGVHLHAVVIALEGIDNADELSFVRPHDGGLVVNSRYGIPF